MKLRIYSPWRLTEEDALADKKYLKTMFQLDYGYGSEKSLFYDPHEHYEYKAFAEIESENYLCPLAKVF